MDVYAVQPASELHAHVPRGTRQQLNDRRVALSPFDELIQRYHAIQVLVHLPEDLVGPLLRGRLVLRHLHGGADHGVNRADDVEHLWSRDRAVAVAVVHGEGPLQLGLQVSARRDAQRDDELAKVDGVVVVLVERPEDVGGELRGVSLREEVRVDLLELLQAEYTAGTVFDEALVPALKLKLVELRRRRKVSDVLWSQSAHFVAHFYH